jgi:outer membrane protein OmpA-like peptidoglycan-associated protein
MNEGVFVLSRPPGAYEVFLSAPGRGTLRATVTIGPDAPSTLDFVIPKGHTETRDDRIVLLDMVRFETNSDRIEMSSLSILDEVAETILRNPTYRLVEIQGHTDDQGTDTYNLELSLRRADAVQTYLVSVGVPSGRLVARGYGKKEPLIPGDSDEARRANRRVEFMVTRGAAEAP